MQTLLELVAIVVAIVLCAVAWSRRTWGLVAFWTIVALLVTWFTGGAWLILFVAAVLAAGRWQLVRQRGAQQVVARWHARNKRNAGMASRWELWRHHSALAMRARATVLRP